MEDGRGIFRVQGPQKSVEPGCLFSKLKTKGGGKGRKITNLGYRLREGKIYLRE